MNSKLIATIEGIIPVVLLSKQRSEIFVVVLCNNLLFTLKCLKNHVNFRFNLLSCISGVDLLNSTHRFCVAYELLSLNFNHRIRVKIFLNENYSLDSALVIYVNSSWWEREIWDFFGIFFNKNPDLRRILTDYGFEGFPLRKDFPLSGYSEFNFNLTRKRVVSNLVELAQEQRFFLVENSFGSNIEKSVF